MRFGFKNFYKSLFRSNRFFFLIVLIGTTMTSTIIMFQNFEHRPHERILYPNSNSNHTFASVAPVCNPNDKWVIDIELNNLFAGDSVRGTLNVFDNRGEISITSLMLPNSIGTCTTMPTQNKLRICLDKPPVYEIELKLTSLNGKTVNYRGPAVKGCENYPGEIKTGAY